MRKNILVFILFFSFLLRVISLDKFPVGFTPDEASFGYDAYSVLKTGKDQWGKSFPLVFESFGDYKSPLYSYMTIPSVLIFGLNKFSVRLPNAVLGTAAIYITFLFVRILFTNADTKEDNIKSPDAVAFIASALLAISPWHIMMSRGAFEANITTLLLPLSLYLLFKGLENSKYFIGAALAIGLNVFSYHSAKLVTPLLFIILFIMFKKQLLKNFGIYHKVGMGILFFFVLLFFVGLKDGSSTRIYDVSIFKTSLQEASSERAKAIDGGMDPVIARVVYNKYQAGARHFFGNYITYFSPQFYFSQGPGESTYGMIPGRGVLYWFELPLLIAGFFYLFINIGNKYLKAIAFWILLAPIPAALSIGPGYAANRAVIMLPSVQIVCGLGFNYILRLAGKIKALRLFTVSYALVAVIFFLFFLFDYFVLSANKNAVGMLSGNLEAVKYVSENYQNRKIVVSRKLSEPHIFVAFANKWDPIGYMNYSKDWTYKEMGLRWVDQMPEYKLGNYTFKNINLYEYSNSNTVLVGFMEEFPESTVFDKVFHRPEREKSIVIVDPALQKYAQIY